MPKRRRVMGRKGIGTQPTFFVADTMTAYCVRDGKRHGFTIWVLDMTDFARRGELYHSEPIGPLPTWRRGPG